MLTTPNGLRTLWILFELPLTRKKIILTRGGHGLEIGFFGSGVQLLPTKDVHWTGSGLWRILLILAWIRPVKCFINLGSKADSKLANGKELRNFCQ